MDCKPGVQDGCWVPCGVLAPRRCCSLCVDMRSHPVLVAAPTVRTQAPPPLRLPNCCCFCAHPFQPAPNLSRVVALTVLTPPQSTPTLCWCSSYGAPHPGRLLKLTSDSRGPYRQVGPTPSMLLPPLCAHPHPHICSSHHVHTIQAPPPLPVTAVRKHAPTPPPTLPHL